MTRPRWLWSHCHACAVYDETGETPTRGHEPGFGCPSEGPGADGCEAVWIDLAAEPSEEPGAAI